MRVPKKRERLIDPNLTTVVELRDMTLFLNHEKGYINARRAAFGKIFHGDWLLVCRDDVREEVEAVMTSTAAAIKLNSDRNSMIAGKSCRLNDRFGDGETGPVQVIE